MNRKELIKLLDKYKIEYEITDNAKEVEEGLRLFDEALEKIGIVIPKETQVDTITTENDTEVPKYTTEWASSSDLISRQGAINAIPQTSVDLFENCRNCELLDREQVVDILESLPPVEPKPVCEDAISRADTIKAMCSECEVFPGDDMNCADCTEVAIVRSMPPVTPTGQQEHGRLIDADALIESIKQSADYKNDVEYLMYANSFIDDINNAPTFITPTERPKGKWVPVMNWCTEYGADMRGEK